MIGWKHTTQYGVIAMSDAVPPEPSDPLATPITRVSVRDDASLRNYLYRLWGVPLDEAEERIAGMSESGKRELERRIRAYHQT